MTRKAVATFSMLLVLAVTLSSLLVVIPAASAAMTLTDAGGPGKGDATALCWGTGGGGVLYRGTYSRGVYKYQGGSWVQMVGGSNLMNDVQVNDLAYDNSQDALFAATTYGVFMAENASAPTCNWVDMGFGASYVNCLSFGTSLYAAAPTRVIKRCDDPYVPVPTWNAVSFGAPPGGEVTDIFNDQSTGYAYVACGADFWRVLAGSTLSFDRSFASEINCLGFDSSTGNLYAGLNAYSDQVWRCENPGSSTDWYDIYSGGSPSRPVTNMTFYHDATHDYLLVNSDDLLRCNGPATGSPSWDWLGMSTNSSVSPYGTTGVAAGASSWDGVWATTDITAVTPAFTDISGALSDADIWDISVDSTRNIAYMVDNGLDGIYRFNNSSRTFTGISASPGTNLQCELDEANNKLFVEHVSAVRRISDPDGAAPFSRDVGPGFSVRGLEFDAATGRLFAGSSNDGSVAWSDDASTSDTPTWHMVGALPLVTNAITRLAYDHVHDALYAVVETDNQLWRCTGASVGGVTWHMVSTVTSAYDVAVDPGRDVVYAGTDAGLVRFSAPRTSDAFTDMGFASLCTAVTCDPDHNVVYAYSNYEKRRFDKASSSIAEVDIGGPSQVRCFEYDPGSNTLYAGGYYLGLWYTSYPAVSVNPSSGQQGQTMNVTVTGQNTGFLAGTSTMSFANGIRVNSLSVTSETTATANITVPAGTPVGSTTCNVVTGAETPISGTFRVTAAPPTPSALAKWYLAEGTTAWGFSTYISVQNPNAATARIKMTYQTSTGPQAGPTFTMPARSQATVNPADTLGGKDFSTLVECTNGLPVAVDRTMMWNNEGRGEESHCSVGVNSASRTWYLPEGSTAWGFECYLLIQNPGSSSAADCQVTYMIEGAAPLVQNVSVDPASRKTIDVASVIGARDASIKVSSNLPVIPERAMYRNDRREGHDSIGTTGPATDYYLAEGATGYASGFTTYVLVQNPQSAGNDVTITYMTGTGQVAGPSFHMEANSRKTVKVNDTLSGSSDVSTHVHGSAPLIAERAMYWNAGGSEVCHDSIGVRAPHSIFYLPDGETSNGRETWTLVQNPNAGQVTVNITYMTPTGAGNVQKTETVPAHSRKTFNMAEHSGLNTRAAIMVSSISGGPVMVERAMYWNGRGAGTDTIGSASD